MYLGVVVTNADSLDRTLGVLKAAQERGWRCRCFLTDTGVRLLESSTFRELLVSESLKVDACELSWSIHVGGEGPPGVGMGGQFQDAELVHSCDRTVVF